MVALVHDIFPQQYGIQKHIIHTSHTTLFYV